MVWLIIIDSNVWIFSEIKDAPEHYLAGEKLERHLKNGVAINAIILSEVFHKLSILFDPTVAHGRVETIIRHPSVEWLQISREQAERAMELAHGKLLRINDAIIAQQALDMDTPILTDDVKDFKKVQTLQILPLR